MNKPSKDKGDVQVLHASDVDDELLFEIENSQWGEVDKERQVIKVKTQKDIHGEYWVSVHVGELVSAKHGPMSKEEAEAMIVGMKSFAAPHIVIFEQF